MWLFISYFVSTAVSILLSKNAAIGMIQFPELDIELGGVVFWWLVSFYKLFKLTENVCKYHRCCCKDL